MKAQIFRMNADILLVDDNAVQASTRKAILGRSCKNIQVANSAREALSILTQPEQSTAIRLVITDHCMPGMNGPEFVALLRERIPHVPVIVLSGLLDAEPCYAGLNVIFRMKPFNPEELIKLVTSLLSVEPMTRTA